MYEINQSGKSMRERNPDIHTITFLPTSAYSICVFNPTLFVYYVYNLKEEPLCLLLTDDQVLLSWCEEYQVEKGQSGGQEKKIMKNEKRREGGVKDGVLCQYSDHWSILYVVYDLHSVVLLHSVVDDVFIVVLHYFVPVCIATIHCCYYISFPFDRCSFFTDFLLLLHSIHLHFHWCSTVVLFLLFCSYTICILHLFPGILTFLTILHCYISICSFFYDTFICYTPLLLVVTVFIYHVTLFCHYIVLHTCYGIFVGDACCYVILLLTVVTTSFLPILLGIHFCDTFCTRCINNNQ